MLFARFCGEASHNIYKCVVSGFSVHSNVCRDFMRSQIYTGALITTTLMQRVCGIAAGLLPFHLSGECFIKERVHFGLNSSSKHFMKKDTNSSSEFTCMINWTL